MRRLAESERVGRGGMRRLFRPEDPEGLSLDYAREAAAEAGFLPADSSLSNEYVAERKPATTGPTWRPCWKPLIGTSRPLCRRSRTSGITSAMDVLSLLPKNPTLIRARSICALQDPNEQRRLVSAALRLRERCLHKPFYRAMDEKHELEWWLNMPALLPEPTPSPT